MKHNRRIHCTIAILCVLVISVLLCGCQNTPSDDKNGTGTEKSYLNKGYFLLLKQTLISEYQPQYDSYFHDTPLLKISIAEIVKAADISEEKLRRFASWDGDVTYEYHYDAVYDTAIAAEAAKHSAFWQDCLFCGMEPREEPFSAE